MYINYIDVTFYMYGLHIYILHNINCHISSFAEKRRPADRDTASGYDAGNCLGHALPLRDGICSQGEWFALKHFNVFNSSPHPHHI